MLTDLAIRRAEPKAKSYKLADSGGLFLRVMPNGSKYWRWKYRYAGKEKLLALGVYPEVPLAARTVENEKGVKKLVKGARELRDAARMLLKVGTDPSAKRQQEKLTAKLATETAFEAVAREWHENQLNEWSAHHAADVLHRLEADVFPKIGKLPIAEITAPQLLAVLRTIEHRGAHELARRARAVCGQVFRYGIATGRCERDVAADLRDALKAPPPVKPMAALKESELPEFLKKLEKYDGHPQTKLAVKLMLLTGVRTGTLRAAEWSEINTDKAEWRIPAEHMKMDDAHVVPLSKQALAVLAELRQINGRSPRLFSNQHDHRKMMSENTVLYAFYRMGYHSRATGHGLRSTMATILSEQGYRSELIEHQLAHKERNRVKASYVRTTFIAERRAMLQHWADFLEGLATGAKVQSIKGQTSRKKALANAVAVS